MKLKWAAGVGLGMMLLAVQLSAQQTSPPRPTPPPQPGAQTPPAQAPTAQPTVPGLETEKQQVSYAIGVQIAKGFKSDGIDIDLNTMMKALQDVLSGGKVLMTDQEVGVTLTAFQREMAQKEADTNKKAGDAFMADNAKKDGVVTQPSGLQYKILKPADGKKPADADTVLCNYKGTLIDGTEFDSTAASGKPAALQISALIPGVREALKLMSVGSTYQFVIPSNLAYGPSGAGNTIGPNTTLIFEIELVGIQDSTPAPGAATPAPAAPQAQPKP